MPPKSPFDDILINLPFFISPINLKFSSFSDIGTKIFLKSISILLVISFNTFPSFFEKNLAIFVASKFDPFIKILSLFSIEKLLLKVFTETF